jgi:hypothetical protein
MPKRPVKGKAVATGMTDPKGEAGKLKCPLHLLPPFAMMQTAWVLALGAIKYGPWNWLGNKVETMTYVGAIMRHLLAYVSGEDNDPESGKSHLAHISAGCCILMDADHVGNLIDNRPHQLFPKNKTKTGRA